MVGPADVDDYLAALPEVSRAALEKLRKTIKGAAPEATGYRCRARRRAKPEITARINIPGGTNISDPP